MSSILSNITDVISKVTGYSGYQDFKEAERINEDAKRKYDASQRNIEYARTTTNNYLTELGNEKLRVFNQGSVARFINLASKIAYLDNDWQSTTVNMSVPLNKQLLDIKNIQAQFSDFAECLFGGGVAGGVTALGALGGATLFGTASTGAAISGLSGAAATNATLAWLGGGSLASGGLGVAGGAAVLGGLVVAPIIFVGGWLLSSKGEEALEQAKANQLQANSYMSSSCVIIRSLNNISTIARNYTISLRGVDKLFNKQLDRLQKIVDSNTDYRTYSQNGQNFVIKCFAFMDHIKSLSDIAIMTNDGSCIRRSVDDINKYVGFINKLDEM